MAQKSKSQILPKRIVVSEFPILSVIAILNHDFPQKSIWKSLVHQRKPWPLCTQRWWPTGQCPLCLARSLSKVATSKSQKKWSYDRDPIWAYTSYTTEGICSSTVNLVARPVRMLRICCKSRIQRPAVHWLASSHSQRRRTRCLTSWNGFPALCL